MWDVNVDGYVRGDGVVVVLLKFLFVVFRDGDYIECIIW